MSYSFKDDIASRLPEGYKVSKMYSLDKDVTQIEAIKGELKTLFKLNKVDITNYFMKIPTISLPKGAKENDVYKKISDLYGLGMVDSVDYYNSTPLKITSVPHYVELPISNNSHGYKGYLRCYVIIDPFSGMDVGIKRDICSIDVSKPLDRIRFRNYLMGSLFNFDGLYFVENRLTLDFIEKISKSMASEVGEEYVIDYRNLLINAELVDRYSDGLSDIAIIISSQELFQIRYNGNKTIIKNNDDSDSTSDSSQELPDGDNGSGAENPVGGEGDINTGEQSELPNSSTEGNDSEEDIEIEIE